MKSMITCYKPHSLTPLQAIKQYQQLHPKYQSVKMTYAGRLDPMAEGLLIILTGNECKHKEHYLRLDKTYRIDILWGVATDSDDILGLVNPIKKTAPALDAINVALNLHCKSFDQPYPAYSSKTVNGKPLWLLKTENRIHEIIIPIKTVTIHSIKLLKSYTKTPAQLLENITARISHLQGNFRQTQILATWQRFFHTNRTQIYQLTQIEVACTSGTYMRTLAHDLGTALNTQAIAYNINRTRIGSFQ